VRMPLNGIVWSLAKPSSQDMESLRTLLNQWQQFYPAVHGAPPSALPSTGTLLNAIPTDHSVTPGKERGVP
jgi:hypothetical protein